MSSIEVHFVDEGPADGRVVLMAGSLGSTLEMWDQQAAELSTEYRVVRYDARGHGRSPQPPGPYDIDDLASDPLALLDRLGVDQVDLVGLSLGAMAFLRLAARAPERVRSLTVLCTSALLGPPSKWSTRAATVVAHGTAAVAPEVVRGWFTAERRERDPGLVAWAEDMVSRTPPAGYAACCGAIERMDLRGDLSAIRAPTLALAGGEDPATPAPHLAAIADGVQHGRLLIVPHAAHLANVEQPAVVTDALRTHLADPHSLP